MSDQSDFSASATRPEQDACRVSPVGGRANLTTTCEVPAPGGKPKGAALGERDAEVDFFFDPSCPWAWLTSRWVTEVARLRGLNISWRFLSLRFLNEHDDYDLEGHTLGLRLLRVASAARRLRGDSGVGAFYAAIGVRFHETGQRQDLTTSDGIRVALEEAQLPGHLAEAADDEGYDPELRAEMEQALNRVGPDIGTPVLTFSPPHGPSFFGPVISRAPSGDEALELWDAVHQVALFNGFAELKRSIRDPLSFSAVDDT